MIRRGAEKRREIQALDLIEEAFGILWTAPKGVLACYAAGTLPFVLAFSYFWADMAHHAFAERRLYQFAIALPLLFVWMKTWQALFCRGIHSYLNDEAPPRLTWRRAANTAITQTTLQATGVVVLPFTLLLLVPFGWAYAFYQNISALDDGTAAPLRERVRQASYHSSLWPMQNHLVVWLLSPLVLIAVACVYLLLLPFMKFWAPEWSYTLFLLYGIIVAVICVPLSPFGFFVAINIGSAILVLPGLLKSLFGIETMFTIGAGGVVNPTFFVIVCGLSYVCLDPLAKTAYVLRCFHGDSMETGKDILVQLRRLGNRVATRALSIIFAVAWLIPRNAASQNNRQPSPAELDRALDSVLAQREYAWRMPPERLDEETGFFGRLLRGTVELFSDLLSSLWDSILLVLRWLSDRLFGGSPDSAMGMGGAAPLLRWTVFILIGLICVVVAVMAFRSFRQRRREPSIVAQPVTRAEPNLEDDETTADQLPEDEWIALARELAERGEYRLAMRAYFLGGLAYLAERGLIRVARYKSNREYAAELGRIGHEKPDVVDNFTDSVRRFERIWYGDHSISGEGFERFVDAQRRIRS